MIQCSVTGKFLGEFFVSRLHSGDVESTATQQKLLARDTRESCGLGLGDHTRFIPLQGSGKPQFTGKLSWRQAQRAERGFRYVHFNVHVCTLAQTDPDVTSILGSGWRRNSWEES